MKYLDELKNLNLPVGKFAIFGSGPMAVRGMRESHDLDVIVKKDVWEDLLEKYPECLQKNPVCLKIGNAEVYNSWINLSVDIDELIDTAETIENFPFVKLEYVIEWKKKFGREKDIKDLELIEKYFKNYEKSD